MTIHKTLSKRKAMLAILFAGGLLNGQLPMLAIEPADDQESVMQGIAKNKSLTPEMRAYYLLAMADSYLTSDSRLATQEQFRFAKTSGGRESRHQPFGELANRVSRKNHLKQTTRTKVSAENLKLADAAVENAIDQLHQSSNGFAKLLLYFVASSLSTQSGKIDQAKLCDKILTAAFKSCEGKGLVDEVEIRGASAVLNSMAYSFTPVRIPYGLFEGTFASRTIAESKEKLANESFTSKDVQISEKLLLKAAAMTDRLPSASDLRRGVHRDLVLWYECLDKMHESNGQKQILFDLVGSKSDSILNPQSGACGHLMWWQEKPLIINYRCGMG